MAKVDASENKVDLAPHEQDIALTVDEHCARLWWLSSGEPIRQYCNPTIVFRSAALSRDYTRVVIGSFTGDISLWDVESGQVTVASRPGVGVPVNSPATAFRYGRELCDRISAVGFDPLVAAVHQENSAAGITMHQSALTIGAALSNYCLDKTTLLPKTLTY